MRTTPRAPALCRRRGGGPLSALDRLNRLEQLGAIESAADWLRLRNNAMHEYPDQPDLNAANLNRIHGSAPDLSRALERVRTFAAERFGN